jgi:hypothetical protein
MVARTGRRRAREDRIGNLLERTRPTRPVEEVAAGIKLPTLERFSAITKVQSLRELIGSTNRSIHDRRARALA